MGGTPAILAYLGKRKISVSAFDDAFETLVLSFYQKLNEERSEILAEGLRGGRFVEP